MERRIWNEELETLPPQAQAAMERDRLGAQLDYAFLNSPFLPPKAGNERAHQEFLTRTDGGSQGTTCLGPNRPPTGT